MQIVNLKSILDGGGEEYSLREIAAQKEIIIERDKEIEKLTHDLEFKSTECCKVKEEADNQKEQFELETANWLSEKEKVIR